MKLEELVDYVRSQLLRDAHEPYLWDTQFIVAQLREAEIIFARRTHCLTSDSEDFCELELEPGKTRYKLDSRIIYVQDIMDADGNQLLPRSRAKLPKSIHPGQPRFFTTDAGHRVLRVHPAPKDPTTIILNVAHKPVYPLSMNIPQRPPEIPEEYHLALTNYAAYKAILTNGPEGADTMAADPFRLLWEESLRDGKREAYELRGRPGAAAINNWTLGRR